MINGYSIGWSKCLVWPSVLHQLYSMLPGWRYLLTFEYFWRKTPVDPIYLEQLASLSFSYSCNWFLCFSFYYFRCKHDENQSGRKHVCELCGKGFFTPNSLKEHMFTHSDIKRFSCHICGKQLKNDSCYRRHMVCVHGQKYTCEICNKDFSAINGINLHKREVHGIMY